MAQSERMAPKGDILPASCKVGDSFMLITRSTNLCTFYMCLADNVWTAAIGNDASTSPSLTVG